MKCINKGCDSPGYCHKKGKCTPAINSVATPVTERQMWLIVQLTAAYVSRGHDLPTAMDLAKNGAELFEQRFTVAEARRKM